MMRAGMRRKEDQKRKKPSLSFLDLKSFSLVIDF